MEEQLITFETAKLAKEKGFNIFNIDINLKNNIIINDNDIYIDSKNIDSKYYLYINEDNCVYSLKGGQFNSVIGSFNSFAKEYMLKETNDYFHAPTQSLLQKWLREVHNVHVISHCKNTKNPKGTYTSTVEINNETEYYHYGWDNYEQALEKGLYQALKLI